MFERIKLIHFTTGLGFPEAQWLLVTVLCFCPTWRVILPIDLKSLKASGYYSLPPHIPPVGTGCFLVTHSFLASKLPHHPLWMDLSSLCCYCSVPKSCPTLCDPRDCSTPGFSVPHHLLEFTQVHVRWIGDAIQPSHPLLSSSNIMSQVKSSWGWGHATSFL